MNLDGRISINISRTETVITLHDDSANVDIIKVTLNASQLSEALSGLMHVKCELEVKNLDKVGKVHEHSKFEFEIPDHLIVGKYSKAKELEAYANSLLKNGWKSDGNFNAQGSFFTEGGKDMARCIIRRYNEIN